jgi:hypothetical protein
MCNCIKEINAKLVEAGKNTRLDIPITWSFIDQLDASWVAIKTCKLDDSKREKPVTLLPAYCPFCGEAYAKAKPANTNSQGH